MSPRFALLSRVVAWAPRGVDAEGHRRAGPSAARQRYHRTLFFVIGFWAVATCGAAAVYPPAALVVALAGLAHVVVGYRVEQKRRARETNGTGDQAR